MLVVFLTVTLFLKSSATQDEKQILELYNSGLGSKSDETCTEKEIGCLGSDTISICMPAMNRLYIPCAKPNNYCKDGACLPISEAIVFNCGTYEGTFPDPIDCTLYHICLNGTVFDYKCELDDTVFSPKTNSCTKKSLLYGCSTIVCGQDEQKLPYPSDPSIFFVCENGLPSVLQTCPKFSALNETTQTCEEVCVEEGPIPDLNDEKSFYECILEEGYVLQHRLCPQIENVIESVFDPVKRECVLVTVA